MEHFRILIQMMVQLINLSWNTIEPSLVLMYEKLIALGFVSFTDEIHIIEQTDKQKNV